MSTFYDRSKPCLLATTLLAVSTLTLLSGCGGSASLIDAKPVVELLGAGVPGVLAVPCDKPVSLPDSAMSAGAVERAMGKDRTALTVCGLKHAAVVQFYVERDRGLSKR